MKYAGKKMGMMPPSAPTLPVPAVKKSAPIQKTGATDGKPNTLGGGGRFQQMLNQGKSPALAAAIGRKVYGKKKMAIMAATGKKMA